MIFKKTMFNEIINFWSPKRVPKGSQKSSLMAFLIYFWSSGGAFGLPMGLFGPQGIAFGSLFFGFVLSFFGFLFLGVVLDRFSFILDLGL